VLLYSGQELRAHREKQFTPTMKRPNYGKDWEVDHIRECACFDLTRSQAMQEVLARKLDERLLLMLRPISRATSVYASRRMSLQGIIAHIAIRLRQMPAGLRYLTIGYLMGPLYLPGSFIAVHCSVSGAGVSFPEFWSRHGMILLLLGIALFEALAFGFIDSSKRHDGRDLCTSYPLPCASSWLGLTLVRRWTCYCSPCGR
jgi:hypothetical protein